MHLLGALDANDKVAGVASGSGVKAVELRLPVARLSR